MNDGFSLGNIDSSKFEEYKKELDKYGLFGNFDEQEYNNKRIEKMRKQVAEQEELIKKLNIK